MENPKDRKGAFKIFRQIFGVLFLLYTLGFVILGCLAVQQAANSPFGLGSLALGFLPLFFLAGVVVIPLPLGGLLTAIKIWRSKKSPSKENPSEP